MMRQTEQAAAAELERFKTEIELTAFLAADGWTQDRRASCRSYGVMRRADDKVVVHRRANGHQVWIRPLSPDRGGTIIDYCQDRWGETLGRIRERLRPHLGRVPEPSADWSPVMESAPDLARAAAGWEAAGAVSDPSYLLGRGLTQETLNAYPNSLRQGRGGQFLFRHLRGGEFCGYEYKSGGSGGFSAGGSKGLALFYKGSAPFRRVVVVETAIDALSLAQLDGCPDDTCYISTAGNPSEAQLRQLGRIRAIQRAAGAEIVLAHDADEGGEQQAALISARLDGPLSRLRPEGGKDWNEALARISARKPQRGRDPDYSPSPF